MTENQIVRATSAEPAMSKYLHRRGVALGLPISGTFELTARCNFNCKMCYVHQQNAPELLHRELTAERWLKVAAEARDMGMMFLLLTGGEPLIRDDFPQIYTELVKMGFLVSVNTNASLYRSEIRELFRQYPPSRINVTLYGGSEETYRRLCGNASFERVVSHLREMREDGLQVRLNVSLTPDNIGDMEAIDRISREIGLQAKASSYMYPPVRTGGQVGQNSARFSPEEAGEVMARWNALRDLPETFLERARRYEANEAAEENDACSDTEQEGVLCRAGRSSFWMTWEGKLLPCGTMETETSDPLRDGFAKAWEEVRARTALIRLPKECAACTNRVNCNVCASICKGETGRFDGRPDYLCTMMEHLHRTTIELAKKKREERNQ